jgi:hypothetical protein
MIRLFYRDEPAAEFIMARGEQVWIKRVAIANTVLRYSPKPVSG